jgi:hypothetical protein
VSLIRASAIAGALRGSGYDRDIAVYGASSGRYDELQSGVGEQKRRDLSSRVDIVIMEDDGVLQRPLEIR